MVPLRISEVRRLFLDVKIIVELDEIVKLGPTLPRKNALGHWYTFNVASTHYKRGKLNGWIAKV